MEFRCFSEPQAGQLRDVLAENGIRAGITRRKKYYVVYVKDSEDIVLLLHLMEASVSLMATENARIYKEVRNTVNRRVNCETANIGKTIESAARQMEEIRLLRESGILQTLPPQLREAANLRENNPGASLTELGALRCRQSPMGSHRLLPPPRGNDDDLAILTSKMIETAHWMTRLVSDFLFERLCRRIGVMVC